MTNDEAKELFTYRHLPEHLQLVSRQYYIQMNEIVIKHQERSFHRDAALQKLLEAKDAHVRLVAQKG